MFNNADVRFERIETMKSFARFIVEKRKGIIVVFALLALASLLCIPLVKVNYSLSTYLPEDMSTKKAMDVMKEEFTLAGTAQVMVENVTIPEAQKLKREIESVDGVKSVVWLDDVVDLHQPVEFFDKKTVENYYKDKAALFQIEFCEDDYSLKTGSALDRIKEIVGDRGAMAGTAVNTKVMRESTFKEVLTVTALVVPIFIIILLLTSQSWFEPVIYLLVIGISVLINMGTNIMIGDISFITQSSAAILQFALSMDYSLFLLHRFIEERQKGMDANEAMVSAIVSSFSSLLASSLTTLAGFAALMFMRYRIGLDMGLVLGKGILLSLISVLFLLPSITLCAYKLIERMRHSSFLFSLKKLGKGIIKARVVFLIIVCLLLVPAYLAQKSNKFLYGETALTSGEDTNAGRQAKKIEEKFGINNPVVLLVPKGSIANETALSEEFAGKGYISGVQGLVTLADPSIPQEMLPTEVLENFTSENYSRMILTLNIPVESEITFEAVEDIQDTVAKYCGEDYYLLGSSTSVSDIKRVVDRDFAVVNWISIAAVALIILFTFRSLSLPVLLVMAIEAAIWLNMAIPYFMDSSLSFIGYMIVSAIQLGATIDYAILLTNRYVDNRRSMGKREAAVKALCDSGWSVITSALILFVAGMGMSIVSSIKGVAELGLLVGRGAALSGAMAFLVIPQLLVVFDRLIRKTTGSGRYFTNSTVGEYNNHI